MFFFFFNDTATTEIYTLSLHDALPICREDGEAQVPRARLLRREGLVHPPRERRAAEDGSRAPRQGGRSEEHTSELQSRLHLVCRLLLEKKKQNYMSPTTIS